MKIDIFKNYYQISALVFIFLFIISCSSEEESISPVVSHNTDEISIQHGRVIFQNESSVSIFMKEAHKKNFKKEYGLMIQRFENNSNFKSLLPFFEEHEINKIEQYKQRKLAKLQQEAIKNGRTFSEEIDMIDDEDELIADSYFASLLNEDREIQVGDVVYKYTEYGAFYTHKDNLSAMYTFIEQSTHNSLADLPYSERTEVAPGVFLFKEDYRSGISDTYQPVDQSARVSTNNSVQTTMSFPDPNTYDICGRMNNNIISGIFGPAITCHTNFDSNERLHIRGWNQNYAFYASFGIKVKAQKKRLGIYFEYDIDELILGYEGAEFSIPLPKIDFGFPQYNYQYSYNGILVDQYGRLMKDNYIPFKFFESFPTYDRNYEFVEIVLWNPFGKDPVWDLTGADVNSYAKQLFKQGVSALTRAGKGLNATTLNTKPGVIAEFSPNDLHINHINWHKKATNTSRIERIFDWNAGFTIKFNPSNFNPGSLIPQPKAVSYKKARVTFYGIGRRGSDWRGKRVEYTDTK